MQTPHVVGAGPGEVDRLTGPLTLAFATDEFVRWLLPEPRVYLACFPALARIHAERVARQGGAFRTEDGRAAALWYPPGAVVDGAALGALLERAVASSRLDEVTDLFARMAAHKPEEPHWYLRQVGVDPAVQGRGYGSALLRASLAVVDRDGLPAYLEATSVSNRSLYERFGFVTVGELRTGDSPALWPMLRVAGVAS